jgi:hypothetical protein
MSLNSPVRSKRNRSRFCSADIEANTLVAVIRSKAIATNGR